MGSKSNEFAVGLTAVLVVSLVAALASQCSGDDRKSNAASTVKPHATAGLLKPVESKFAEPQPEPTSAEPKKVTMTLAEIADTPGTFGQFKKFVAKYGTADQQKAVKHLTGWRGVSDGAYPSIDATSDFPTVDYEADGASTVTEDLEVRTQYIAEAFAEWWQIDEISVLKVIDRGGKYAAGVSCIRTDSSEAHGSCL
ncbi:hypothetical protein [Streptomyces sp. NPDC096012]|uniref:hypothetical protein n=1 Tax=Streptomyces sp. NPDC096012 TaxID=3155684 RepID=UPI003369CC10